MGVRRCHGRSLCAAVSMLLFFVMATGGGLAGIVQKREKPSFLSAKYVVEENWRRPEASTRRLSGPGSSPPTCRSRCGRCLPCRPIHVAIQPGQIMTLEYYPEAWRCKCGNKLFMP